MPTQQLKWWYNKTDDITDMSTFKLKHTPNPEFTLQIDDKILDTTPPVGVLSTHAIEVRFTCSSCHAEFIQKFKGTHEDYEWLQHHYNKVDHVVVCEPCRNSSSYWDC